MKTLACCAMRSISVAAAVATVPRLRIVVGRAQEDGGAIVRQREPEAMPYQAYHEVVPCDIAELQTRSLTITSVDEGCPLQVGQYGFIEMYCNEVGCDCRRVMLCVKRGGCPTPEAFVAWGWESPAFYVRWLGENDALTLEHLKGPALNLGSPQGAGAELLLREIRTLLAWDSEYVESIKEHYRIFRSVIRGTRSASVGSGAYRVEGQPGVEPAQGGIALETNVLKILQEAGIDTSVDESLPAVGLQFDEDDDLVPPGETLPITDGKRVATAQLKSIPELFTGSREPPVFREAPPRAYVPFFLALERAAYEYCAAIDTRVRDKEFEQAYHDLRRRPDRAGEHPVVLHLQAAARLYMSLRDVSQAEFEGVARRLSRSARTFAMGYSSTNYFEAALARTFGQGR